MTRTTTTTVAVAADYADAMITARRAKNWLFILLLLMLIIEIGMFFFFKFGRRIDVTVRNDPSAVGNVDVDVEASSTAPAVTDGDASPATNPTDTTAGVGRTTGGSGNTLQDVLKYVVGLIVFLVPVLSILLAFTLLLIVLIMLVGRLIGVSHVTSSLIWCALLALLVFPWQAFLDPYFFKIPGVVYTWEELQNSKLLNPSASLRTAEMILEWARFAGFPILALLILLSVQVKSSRGLKFALGEADVQVDLAPGV